jgi:hypothetical protein
MSKGRERQFLTKWEVLPLDGASASIVEQSLLDIRLNRISSPPTSKQQADETQYHHEPTLESLLASGSG